MLEMHLQCCVLLLQCVNVRLANELVQEGAVLLLQPPPPPA